MRAKAPNQYIADPSGLCNTHQVQNLLAQSPIDASLSAGCPFYKLHEPEWVSFWVKSPLKFTRRHDHDVVNLDKTMCYSLCT